ncbi:MAG: branched-chain amino acid aminotransferase [Muribaculaceae bacterium]|jgi:branched-chain amino acid aminotransferase|nr:branched-chain amino acid aminotransferase [Muribaculaceae bacterium]
MEKTVNMDWAHIPFGYVKTDYNVRCTFKNGEWGPIEVTDSERVDVHMAATCLHYGQEIFEGQKAFRGKDGKIRIFRINDNAERIQRSANGILMQPMPIEKFREMAIKVVKLNERFIPPYGSGASLYIRPLEIGMSAQVGVSPATEYLFIMFVTPVGPYFKEGFKPTKVAIYRDYDRAAPCGTGRWKVGGNYAASLTAGDLAHKNGYSAVLYLDPKEKKYIDECGPANFFAIKGNKYITPKSGSILPSITNMSLQQIAKDMGLEIECRPMHVEELAEIDEAAECGTAAVAAPISEVDDVEAGKKYVISKDGNPGPVTTKLYNHLRAIQLGDEEDKHGWVTVLD